MTSPVRAAAFFALTGVLAVVIVMALLLFGVTAHHVFAPGFFVKSLFERAGLHVPNAVGVASTLLIVWIIIVALRFAIVRAIRARSAR
jgi:hypothetical protein